MKNSYLFLLTLLLCICCTQKRKSENVIVSTPEEETLDTVYVENMRMMVNYLSDTPDSIVYLYTGCINLEDSLPYKHGHAVVVDGRYKKAIYDGDFFSGLFDGNGTIKFEDGASFEGSFIMGTYVEGKYIESDGGYLVGIFSDDMPQDVKVYDSNDEFLGEAHKSIE